MVKNWKTGEPRKTLKRDTNQGRRLGSVDKNNHGCLRLNPSHQLGREKRTYQYSKEGRGGKEHVPFIQVNGRGTFNM